MRDSIPTHSMLVIGDDDDDDDEDEEDDDDEEEDDGDDDDDDQDDDEDEQEGQDDSEDGNDDNDDDDDDVDDDDDDGIVDVDATATAAVTGRDGGEWTGSRPVMENLTKKTMKVRIALFCWGSFRSLESHKWKTDAGGRDASRACAVNRQCFLTENQRVCFTT